MARSISPLVLFGALVLLSKPVRAQARPDRPETPPPEVRTSVTVQRTVQPDLATVTVGLAADGVTPAQAGSRLALRVDSLRRALATLGIPRDSVVNRSRWYWWRGRMEIIPEPVRYVPRAAPAPDGRVRDALQDTTYRAHDALEIRIRDLGKVGAVLDTIMGRGIADISEVRFTAGDPAAAQEEALREATVRARRQAEAIAAASNLQLGRALGLSTQGDYNDRYRTYDAVSLSGVSVGAGTPTVVVQPAIPLSVTVYGRWELIAKP